MKLDESDNGLGIATISMHGLAGLSEALVATQDTAARVLQRCGVHVQSRPRRWPQASVVSFSEAQIAELNEARLGCEHSICQCLLRGLPRALRMAAPDSFPTYRSFVQVGFGWCAAWCMSGYPSQSSTTLCPATLHTST